MLPYASYLYCPVVDRPLDLSVVVFCVSNIFVILFDAVEILYVYLLDSSSESSSTRTEKRRGANVCELCLPVTLS